MIKKLFWLAFRSIKSRASIALITIISLSLSFVLLFTVERLRREAEVGFTQSISQTDLIVGARGGALQLLLFTVFHLGSVQNNVSLNSYQKFLKHPSVEWAIPIMMGDGHRGFPVIGTNESYYKNIRFRGDQKIELLSGEWFGLNTETDAVIGSEVAEVLGYQLGQSLIVSHGVIAHDKEPFKVKGILKATGTPIDRGIFVPMIAYVHMHDEHHEHEHEGKHEGEHLRESLAAFYVRTKNRVETLSLQREINDYKEEPLSALIPAQALQDLWRNLSFAEKILRLISYLVLIVGMLSMLLVLLSTLQERRKEMAILRSIGLKSNHLRGLFLIETLILTSAGLCGALIISFVLSQALGPWILREWGFSLNGVWLTWEELTKVIIVAFLGLIVGLIAAERALRLSVKDGLTVK
jgi:putative ABC transport system permease protein